MYQNNMTCDKCTDIHEAQKSGKTQDACKCNCHKESNPLISPNPNYIPYYPNYDPCCPTIPYSPIWTISPHTICRNIDLRTSASSNMKAIQCDLQ